MLPTSFYLPDGARLRATDLTRGPWDPRLQHGGPPTGLLVRAIEAAPTETPRALVRLTVELLRPIPIGPVAVEVDAPVGGRQVDRVVARLLVDGREAARAVGVRVREADLALPARAPDVAPLTPAPAALPSWQFPFFAEPVGYQAAVEVKIARGTWGTGPIAAWLRPTVALVAGEPTSPRAAAAIVADAANGVRPILPIDRYTFVNADLTLAFARTPRGGWTGLDVDATPGDAGAGVTHAALHDEAGLVGHAVLSVVLAAR